MDPFDHYQIGEPEVDAEWLLHNIRWPDITSKDCLLGFNEQGIAITEFGGYWLTYGSGDSYGLMFKSFPLETSKSKTIVNIFETYAGVDYVIDKMQEHYQIMINDTKPDWNDGVIL